MRAALPLISLLALSVSTQALAQTAIVDPNATPGPNVYDNVGDAVSGSGVGWDVIVYPGDYSGEGMVTVLRDMQIIGTDQAGVLLPPMQTGTGVFGFPTVTIENATLSCPAQLVEPPAVYKHPGADLNLVDLMSNCGDAQDRVLVLAHGQGDLNITTSSFLGSGSHLISDGANVTITDSTFSGLNEVSRALLYRDTLGAVTPGTISITGSTFTAYDKPGFNGGAIYVNAVTTDVTITDSAFRDNDAASGSGLYIRDAPSVLLEGLDIENNTNGAVALVDSVVTVRDSLLLANPGDALVTAGTGSLDVQTSLVRDNAGLGLQASLMGGTTVTGSHFCNNMGDVHWTDGDLTAMGSTFALGNGVVDAFAAGPSTTGTLTTQNVTIAGYEGDGIWIDAATGYTIDASETIFHDLAGNAVFGDGTPAAGTGAYNNFFAVTGAVGAGQFVPADFDPNSTTVDPMFQGYVDRTTTTCDTLNLWLDPASPLRDLGLGTDLDGSASDIGAYGGPFADLTDADGDNAFEDIDCNEADATIYPGAVDIAHDGIDQDCDGADNLDGDGDGFDADYAGGTDCNDLDATIYPGAPEVAGDGIDQDCDGTDLTDGDGDGYDGVASGGTDCDDTNADINPGATEVWYDGIDSDCSGGSDYDQDGDGYDSEADSNNGDDCDDLDPGINPGVAEIAGDGIDQDCDGTDGATGTGTGTGTGTATGTGTGGPDDTGTGGGKAEGCACDSTPSPANAWGLLAGLALLLRRRR